MLQTMASTSRSDSGVTAPVRREAVSIRDAARLLDVHQVTIRRLIAAGKLRAFRVGRVLRIRRDVLADFVRSR